MGQVVGDGGALVAALGDVARVAEAAHQLRPCLRDAARVPADLGRLGREAIAGQGRQHEVERILGGTAVRDGVREGADRLEQFDHRPRPAVRHDERQCVVVLGVDVDEVDVHAVDLGRELRRGIQPRFDAAEVVLARPVVSERLERRQLDALRAIVDGLLRGPARGRDAPAQVVDLLFRDLEVEGSDLSRGLDGAHGCPPFVRSDLKAARSSFANSSSSPVSLVVRLMPETRRAASRPPPSPWSSSQAARPVGESASAYRVCGRDPMNLEVRTTAFR
jgi:hypothetical protein